MEAYVAPYVQVRHAIHLLYATSPRSRDGADHDQDSDGPVPVISGTHRVKAQAKRTDALTATFTKGRWQNPTAMNHRFDKLGNPMPLELHGCGCGLCARQQRELHQFWEGRCV